MINKTATIAFVNSIPKDTFGGGEQWFFNAAKELQKRGHKIVLIARPQSKLVEKFRQINCAITELTFGSDYNPVNIYKLVKLFRLIRLMRT